MRILLIEDDAEITRFIRSGMTEAGHMLESAADGEAGLNKAIDGDYEVIIVDRMLPKLEGLALVQKLRAAGRMVPVLFLSALGDVDDRVKGLRAGGDDYLVKPFAFDELLARIEVLARRAHNSAQGDATKLSAGDLEMDLIGRRVTRSGQEIDLQTREFRLLEYMLRHKGQLVTRSMLLEYVWEYHFDPQTNVIDVHISRLRSKIDKGHEHALIRTVRGAGYVIDDAAQ